MSTTNTRRACAPVLLIGFNRPDFMAAQIAALRPARPRRLYIAVDGPREDRPGEAALCEKVRRCVSLVDWPCETKTLFREKNLGCKHGVSQAISWFFENEPEGIVLEDDCRPSPAFFAFATDMLARYRDDGRVGAVCGFNHFNLQSDREAAWHFSRHMDVWGWASWRRVWKDYDVDKASDASAADALVSGAKLTPYYRKFYRKIAQDVQNGLSTWDMQFTLLFLEKGYLSAVPKERLIANAGLADGRATHTGGWVYWAKRWSQADGTYRDTGTAPEVACDERADLLRERMEGAIVPRALTWLGSKFPPAVGILSAAGAVAEKLAPFLFRL